MPYRRPVDVALQRCSELHEQLETLAGVRVERPTCATLEDALAWEAELRADVQSLGGMVVPVGSAARDPRKLVFAVVGVLVALGLAALVVLFQRHEPGSTGPKQVRDMLAGNVLEAPPPAHAGDRCEIEIRRDRVDCTLDIDCICPTIERRVSAQQCIAPGAAVNARTREFDLDGAHGRLVLMTADGPIDVELDGWR